VHAPPSPAKADFPIMMECTPELGHCHSVCTLCSEPTNCLPTPRKEPRRGGSLKQINSCRKVLFCRVTFKTPSMKSNPSTVQTDRCWDYDYSKEALGVGFFLFLW
jgi:hypothetical protein